MHVRVLGSGAGGGLPQWNCGCAHCRAARAGDPAVPPRSQSSLCVSADGTRWVLINASPDVRTQLATFAPLAPREGTLRGSGMAAVVLTNADIDHCAGLLVLREGGPPPLYATARVLDAVTQGLGVLPALAAYGPTHPRTIEPGVAFEVCDRAGGSTGVTLRAFTVASKPPPYMAARAGFVRPDDHAGDTIGLVISDAAGMRSIAYVPGVRDLDATLAEALAGCDTILIDGTCYTDDELVTLGASTKTAKAMGHAPLDGPEGTLAFLGRFPRARRVLVHINNTNPIVRADSDARRAVERAGIEVGYDGMDL